MAGNTTELTTFVSIISGATYPAVVYCIEFDGVFCKVVNSEVSVFTTIVCESTADFAILNAVVFVCKVAVAVSKLDNAIFFSFTALLAVTVAVSFNAIATVALSTIDFADIIESSPA